jgi:TPR repeat protein
MRSLWRTVVPTTCGLSILLIGGVSYSCGRENKPAYLETGYLERYRKAADQGNADAQVNLGVMYAEGQGVKRDYTEAVRWYRKAAEQGYALAQWCLGVMYEDGHGLPQDYAEAVRWYRKAADQGNADAQFALGVMYAEGRGVTRDYAEAHMWFNLANSRASGVNRAECATERDLVAKKMTPQQIAEARRRAREWKPKTGEDKGGGPMK